MRWFVEISPLGKSEAKPELQCVEAAQWQEAIKGARRAAGLDDALRNFSIEVLDEGVRAVDPMSRLRYVIRRAPSDAPLTGAAAQVEPVRAAPSHPPAAPAPPSHPPAASPLSQSAPPPPGTRPRPETMVYGSPRMPDFSQAVQPQPQPEPPPYTRAVFPPPSKPAPAQPAPKPIYSAPKPAPVPSFNVLAKREEDPSKASPLSYREYAYAIAEGSSEAEAEKFIVERFKEIRDGLSAARSAKLVNLAVFDHQFQGKPKRPPLVTLVWKDWKGEPEIRFTSRPGVSIPSPSLGNRLPASMPPAKPSDPPAPKQTAIRTPPSTPVAIRQNRGNLGPPQPTMRSAESAIDPSSLGAKVQVRSDPPAPQPVQPAPVAVAPQPVAAQPVAPQPIAPQPQPARVAPQPAKVARKSTPPRPLTGDEIIADIFESMHDLHFLRDAYEGADFVIALALDKMRCKMGMAQLYDINRREFVVAHAVGPGADKALGNRTTEHDPMLIEIMNRRTPFVIHAKDDRIREGRWSNLGGEPQTILACSVAQGGRFLGILELAHDAGEGEFRKADIDGMAYIAQSFAEFVAKTGLLFGSEESLMRR